MIDPKCIPGNCQLAICTLGANITQIKIIKIFNSQEAIFKVRMFIGNKIILAIGRTISSNRLKIKTADKNDRQLPDMEKEGIR